MRYPEWIKENEPNAVELIVPAQGVLLVVLGLRGSVSSAAAVLRLQDVDRLRQLSDEFKEWFTDAIGKDWRGLSFRLIGNSVAIAVLNPHLVGMGIAEGKHIATQGGDQTVIHFLASSGRIRMLRSDIGKPLVTSGNHSQVSSSKTRVLVVDDSETIRKLLSKILNEDPNLDCVATVDHPKDVEAAILKFRPDVITLDIHMPEMDGVTLLKRLLPKYLIPTVMISALSKEDGTYVLDALEAGAVDYIQKPSMQDIKIQSGLICEKIKAARFARVRRLDPTLGERPARSFVPNFETLDTSSLIAIGSSTGGTEALKIVLTQMPETIPPVLVVQHIPPVFSKAFADRMNELCRFEVKEAADGDAVTPNRVLIAPGGLQMKVKSVGEQLRVVIDDSAPVNRHKPSVDVLFESIALLQRRKVVAAILTGMGTDGAKGMLKLRQGGANTLAQSEATCVVYGMPKEAVKLGGVEKIVPLEDIAKNLLHSCARRARSA